MGAWRLLRARFNPPPADGDVPAWDAATDQLVFGPPAPGASGAFPAWSLAWSLPAATIDHQFLTGAPTADLSGGMLSLAMADIGDIANLGWDLPVPTTPLVGFAMRAEVRPVSSFSGGSLLIGTKAALPAAFFAADADIASFALRYDWVDSGQPPVLRWPAGYGNDQVNVPLSVGEWHTLEISMQGVVAVYRLDGVELATYEGGANYEQPGGAPWIGIRAQWTTAELRNLKVWYQTGIALPA